MFGGDSPEHLVSVKSALFVLFGTDISNLNLTGVYVTRRGSVGTKAELIETINELCRKQYIDVNMGRVELDDVSIIDDERSTLLEIFNSRAYDVIFPLFHGKNGEDGSIQGLLHFSGIPFIGCDAAGSFLCMDKSITKRLAQSYGIPVVRFIDIRREEWIQDRRSCISKITESLPFPLFLKPAKLGSSIGIVRCDARETIEEDVERVFTYDDKIVIEECVEAKEYSIGIMGSKNLLTSSVAEVGLDPQAFDFEAKYGPTTLPDTIPTILPADQVLKLEVAALSAYRALGLNGMARLDFFHIEGDFYLNEINTIPGLGGNSLFNRMWDSSGISFSELMVSLYDDAMEQVLIERNTK